MALTPRAVGAQMFPGDMVAEGAASPFSAAILNANLHADDYAAARVWICWNVRDAGLLDGVLPGSILGPDGKIALPHGPAHCHAVEGAVAAGERAAKEVLASLRRPE